MNRTGKEIVVFLGNLRTDYKHSGIHIPCTKRQKRQCYWRIVGNIFILIWGIITAPLIYPIWYVFRKPITNRIHRGTSWQEIKKLNEENRIQELKSKLKKNGWFLYWLWTYGDIDDPLGWGGLPESRGKNNFWNRYKWSAFRNARFNINYVRMRTAALVPFSTQTTIDTRNFKIMHRSFGIGDSPDGIVFRWMEDVQGKWYFVYEDSNKNALFWFGYVGLGNTNGSKGLRFEAAYRKTEGTYTIDIKK